MDNLKIILADDDPDDRDLFTEAVLEQNADIQTFKNGVQLMDILKKGESGPDIILLDLNMPEKSGKQCLKEIRSQNNLQNIPVVIYSTSSNKLDIEETFKLGANMYVTKPASYRELRKTVKDLLNIDWKAQKPCSSKDNYVYIA